MTPHACVPSDDDRKLDERIGKLLRAGTLSSSFVILLGGVLFLARHSHDRPHYHTFKGVPPGLHTLSGIVAGAFHGDSLAIIQLGLLMLIATPIARVVLSIFAFLAERDILYVVISGIVLAVLLYSFFAH
ncbi:MAG TPA: DUF1634 domain-containing protein [Acidobacteriaceae bacterium]|jgi:uncharacterized membrane protein